MADTRRKSSRWQSGRNLVGRRNLVNANMCCAFACHQESVTACRQMETEQFWAGKLKLSLPQVGGLLPAKERFSGFQTVCATVSNFDRTTLSTHTHFNISPNCTASSPLSLYFHLHMFREISPHASDFQFRRFLSQSLSKISNSSSTCVLLDANDLELFSAKPFHSLTGCSSELSARELVNNGRMVAGCC